jgi:hypothetical protein
MPRFQLQLNTDNAAFEDDSRGELARILRKTADHVEGGGEIEFFQTIFDLNGNDVGRFALKDESYFEGGN